MKNKVLQFAHPVTHDYQRDPSRLALVRENYLYTLDLILNDYHKNHQMDRCVVCEPMKLMGCHRDQVIADLTSTMVKVFFGEFQEYREEIKAIVLEKLLRKDANGKVYATLKERMQALVLEQLRADVKDFINDIEKHMGKYVHAFLDEPRRETIVDQVIGLLHKNWIPHGGLVFDSH